MAPLNLVLFVDGQNVYHGARRAFFNPQDSHVSGQYNPMALGRLIASRSPDGTQRVLKEVRVYTGRPDATKQPKPTAAHMKQAAAWQKLGVTVIARTLRYPRNWPKEKAEEKGIDVALAIDFARMAHRGDFDVGVLFSTDTDLIPALEMVCQDYPGRVAEVAAWHSPTYRNRLRVKGARVWCHLLAETDYHAVADLRDYNL